MQRRDLLNRIARLERERGLSAQQRSSLDYCKRFEAALGAYEAERDRISEALPPGWRLVTDHTVNRGGFVVGNRHRATRQPAGIENGVDISTETKEVLSVNVQNGGACHARPACEEDAKWQAEYDLDLPENLRGAIQALKTVSFIDFINHEAF